MVLVVCKRLGRCHHSVVTRVHTHTQYVLHVAHRDGVPSAIPHYLELYLLPVTNIALNEHLAHDAVGKTSTHNGFQLIRVPSNTTTPSPQRERSPNDHGVAYLLRHAEGLLEGVGLTALKHIYSGVYHGLLEHRPVRRPFDGLHTCTQHPHTVLFEDALLLQYEPTVERRLPTEAE